LVTTAVTGTAEGSAPGGELSRSTTSTTTCRRSRCSSTAARYVQGTANSRSRCRSPGSPGWDTARSSRAAASRGGESTEGDAAWTHGRAALPWPGSPRLEAAPAWPYASRTTGRPLRLAASSAGRVGCCTAQHNSQTADPRSITRRPGSATTPRSTTRRPLTLAASPAGPDRPLHRAAPPAYRVAPHTSRSHAPALHPLDDRRGAHAAAGAHGDQPDRLVPALQLVQHRLEQHRTGRADRMPQRDGATVDIDPVLVVAQVAHHLQRDRGERLVDLPQVHVVDGHPRLLQAFARRRAGRGEHDDRLRARDGPRDDPRPRGQPVRLGELRGGQHPRAG